MLHRRRLPSLPSLGDEGGGIGPDLTAAANRYTLRDLVENIVEPNKVISDQYENSIIVLSDGSTVIGRITGEEGDILHVATNPNAPGQVSMVHQSNIESRQVSPTSIMPPGLLNAMNSDEVADLLAYILSRGDKQGKMFTK